MFTIERSVAAKMFEELLERALKGEDVVITDEEKIPLVRFVPVQGVRSDRVLDGAKGLIVYMSDDFNEPLDDIFAEYVP
ncbi:type II toxin-antitoxin system Phd/YefM family antitoxin [Spirochaeta thermophila]|uniref:Prevent-host-death family protein n=2 Tax=Winmispira thermophila TaxID=154 RepID=G0GFL1_WINT7|nr:hypothetical protein [Spirochaeta thermophila]ADN03041.1 hypothetical protein STHERM_c21100 [Spirochaeta thermophila DSM 6192]AEJ62410.1 hypothetical protein Spith_2155 [Spirochaeta thermophila DSM 6578]